MISKTSIKTNKFTIGSIALHVNMNIYAAYEG